VGAGKDPSWGNWWIGAAKILQWRLVDRKVMGSTKYKKRNGKAKLFKYYFKRNT